MYILSILLLIVTINQGEVKGMFTLLLNDLSRVGNTLFRV